MNNISGYGIQLRIIASFTFPTGITITQFADDSDPFDLPSIQIADKAMGLNGDLITWSKANPIIVNLSVIPNSVDDKNLGILLEANRVGKGKLSVQDQIIMSARYPEGTTLTLTTGTITDGMPSDSVASAGRLKSKTYSFAFENRVVF